MNTAPTDRTAQAGIPARSAVHGEPGLTVPPAVAPGPGSSSTPAAPALARGRGAAGHDPSRGGEEVADGRDLGEGCPPTASSPALVIVVFGTPGPQGSKKHVGRGVMIESSKKVKPWRARVEAAAREQAGPGWATLDEPLRVEFVFSLLRGKTVRRARHTTYPDLSKLIRSTEDALTAAGIWADDARITDYHQPRKRYAGQPGDDPDVLPEPGAVIRIWPITPEGPQ